MTGISHIAGLRIDTGALTRQRCAWCGALLVDADLARMAFMEGDDHVVSTWPVGAQVRVDGSAAYVVHAPDDESPVTADSRARLDPGVTK